MKMAAKLALLSAAMLIGLPRLQAQTNTNVDFLTLHLNIALIAHTNGVPETNGNLATATSGTVRLTTKDVIQALSNKVVFPVIKALHPDGYGIPALGPGVRTNFSNAARLLILQGLGTNHGRFFVVVRDGRPPVDYDVSDYFIFSRRGFSPATGDTVTTTGTLNLDDGTEVASQVYLGVFEFDNSAFDRRDTTKTAFTVDGFTTARKNSVRQRGVLVDGSATRSLGASVAGTGMLGSADAFAVLRGHINAGAPRHEIK